MHRGANPRLDDLTWTKRAWNPAEAYAESKFLDVLIAFAVARRWPNVLSNALEPGWVATRMGGARVSTVHGNFIVNDGNATAGDVLALIDKIQTVARKERGIELETEVQILGEL